MPDHKILWSNPADNRHLVADKDTMTLHVLKLDPGAPAPAEPLTPEQAKELRPIDWGSAHRIVGPENFDKFVEALVDKCWSRMEEVSMIFINAPDKWPARTSFHAQAAARGTAMSPRGTLGMDTPLDAFGLGGFNTQKLSAEVRARGKFANIDEVAKRMPREVSRMGIRRSIITVLNSELSGASQQAMFFAKRDGKFVFRLMAAPLKPKVEDDDAEGDHRPPPPSRYRM